MKQQERQQAKKEAFIEALEKSLGVIAPACRAIGIARRTYYNWLKDDPAFAAAVDAILNDTGDFVEGKLLQLINEGDTAAIIFYCKTKLKSRGYSERQTFDVQGIPPTTLVVSNQEIADKISNAEKYGIEE
ncbi:MAG: hypothetical protein LUC22_00440 [Prevotella sp.]|nr:hypothetical protein [Prevotella sp.]